MSDNHSHSQKEQYFPKFQAGENNQDVYQKTNTDIQFQHPQKINYDINFELGQVVVFEKEQYKLTEMYVKRVDSGFQWLECVLCHINNPDMLLYLSESEGHFIIGVSIDYEIEPFSVNSNQRIFEYNNTRFSLYDYNDVTHIAMMNHDNHCFEVIEVHENNTHHKNQHRVYEYISGEELITIEHQENKEGIFNHVYYGRHISRKDVKKMFQKTLPPKKGVGLVTPFFMNVKVLSWCFIAVIITALLTQIVINSRMNEQSILQTQLSYDKSLSQPYISPSFILEGYNAPLKIRLNASVNNSWTNVAIGLIDEKTNDEVYTAKDIEYYSGYEDGGSWSEGKTDATINVCGIQAGTYHLVFYPSKEDNNMQTIYLDINIKWGETSFFNFWFLFFAMLTFWFLIYFWKNSFERRRWQYSDFKPYKSQMD